MNGPLGAACAAAIVALAAESLRGEDDGPDRSESIPGKEIEGGIGAAQSPRKKPRPRAVLVISSEGLRLEEPGKAEKRFETVLDLVREAPWVGGVFLIKGRELTGETSTEPAPEKLGKKRSLVEGEIPLAEIARFLADYTGLPVITGSGPSLAGRTILVPSSIDEVDDELVKQLLRTNGILVTEEAVGLDEKALFLEAADAASAGPGEPVPRPVVSMERESGRSTGSRQSRRDFRTAKGPEPKEGMFHGLGLLPVPEMLAAQLPIDQGRGVLVASVDEKALAAERDLKVLQVHDVITKLNEDTVDSPEEFQQALERIPPGAPMDMRILRKGITRILRTQRGHR
jgi:hypothetical protein